jgi:hypothetical protein
MLREIGVTHIIGSFCILSAWFAYLHTDVDKVLKEYTNRDSKEWSIYFLWKASYGYTVVKHYFGKLHSTFPLIHSFADSMQKLSNKYTNPQTKPNAYPCASITRFTDNSDGTYKISEDYYDIVDFSSGDNDTLEKLINMSMDVLQSDDTITECLIKLSISPEYTLFRVINRIFTQMKTSNDATTSQDPINSDGDKTSILNTSSVKFLSIEYEHPDMNEPICIKLPTSFYLEGNCILSAAFIRQWLAETGVPYVFDNRYTIYIIDQDVYSISLSNKEYITILPDKKYTIATYLELPVTDIFSVENHDICKDDNNNNNNQLITKEMDDMEETKSWDRLSM